MRTIKPSATIKSNTKTYQKLAAIDAEEEKKKKKGKKIGSSS